MRYLILSLLTLYMLHGKMAYSLEDCFKVDELIYKDMCEISESDNINYVELHRDEIILVIKGKLIVLPTKGEVDETERESNSKEDKKS